jgi:hypothetical protein
MFYTCRLYKYIFLIILYFIETFNSTLARNENSRPAAVYNIVAEVGMILYITYG